MKNRYSYRARPLTEDVRNPRQRGQGYLFDERQSASFISLIDDSQIRQAFDAAAVELPNIVGGGLGLQYKGQTDFLGLYPRKTAHTFTIKPAPNPGSQRGVPYVPKEISTGKPYAFCVNFPGFKSGSSIRIEYALLIPIDIQYAIIDLPDEGVYTYSDKGEYGIYTDVIMMVGDNGKDYGSSLGYVCYGEYDFSPNQSNTTIPGLTDRFSKEIRMIFMDVFKRLEMESPRFDSEGNVVKALKFALKAGGFDDMRLFPSVFESALYEIEKGKALSDYGSVTSSKINPDKTGYTTSILLDVAPVPAEISSGDTLKPVFEIAFFNEPETFQYDDAFYCDLSVQLPFSEKFYSNTQNYDMRQHLNSISNIFDTDLGNGVLTTSVLCEYDPLGSVDDAVNSVITEIEPVLSSFSDSYDDFVKKWFS